MGVSFTSGGHHQSREIATQTDPVYEEGCAKCQSSSDRTDTISRDLVKNSLEVENYASESDFDERLAGMTNFMRSYFSNQMRHASSDRRQILPNFRESH